MERFYERDYSHIFFPKVSWLDYNSDFMICTARLLLLWIVLVLVLLDELGMGELYILLETYPYG